MVDISTAIFGGLLLTFLYSLSLSSASSQIFAFLVGSILTGVAVVYFVSSKYIKPIEEVRLETKKTKVE
jgi:hypothetical protein